MASSGNVALAVSTLVWVRETVRLAVAVELAKVPARPVLVAVVLAPLWGVAVTTIVVPRGTLAALRVTWTGFVVPVGRMISGAVRKLPLGVPGAATPATLHAILRAANVRTWSQLSVDGDTSTNDTVFVLASGMSGTAPVVAGSAEAAALARAIEAVARDLARQQAADGEGATTLITCQVSGALDDAEARAVARAVVASSLVKAAVHGRDPNWGRIAAAAGNALLAEAAVLEAAGLGAAQAIARAGAPATVDPDRMRIAIAGHLVFDGSAGGPQAIDRGAARAAMTADECLVRVDVGLGDGTGEAFGCDLTEQYVIENSEYTT